MSLRDLGVIQAAEPTAGAGYAAILAAARASANAGDWYEDSQTGAAFRYYAPSGSPGILIPASLYDSLDGYESNASGSAYLVAASDTEAQIVARGWTAVDGAGTVTGGGGSPFHINGGAYIQFVPTTIGTRYLMMAAISDLVGTTGTGTQLYAILGDGAATSGARYRAGFTAGTAGICEINSGAATVTATRGALTISGTAWVTAVLDDDASDRLCTTVDLSQDPRLGLVCETGDLITSTSKLFRLGCSASHEMKVHEFHVIKMTV